MIKITNTSIRLITHSETGKLKAVATIIIDDSFAIHDIKLIDGKDGIFVAMPSRKSHEGYFKDIAHPLNSEVRNYVCTTILDAYKHFVSNTK